MIRVMVRFRVMVMVKVMVGIGIFCCLLLSCVLSVLILYLSCLVLSCFALPALILFRLALFFSHPFLPCFYHVLISFRLVLCGLCFCLLGGTIHKRDGWALSLSLSVSPLCFLVPRCGIYDGRRSNGRQVDIVDRPCPSAFVPHTLGRAN